MDRLQKKYLTAPHSSFQTGASSATEFHSMPLAGALKIDVAGVDAHGRPGGRAADQRSGIVIGPAPDEDALVAPRRLLR
jgi:hypothetical protein